jgi:hypothetical protein
MKHDGKRSNWHAGHPIKTRDRLIRGWIPRFRDLAAELKKDGVEVINASEETALDAFPRRPIAELLPDPCGLEYGGLRLTPIASCARAGLPARGVPQGPRRGGSKRF